MIAKKKTLSKSDKDYNKDVNAYNWFVVADHNDIEGGYEFKSDAKEFADELNEYPYKDKKWKVVSYATIKQWVKQYGIIDPKDKWTIKIGVMPKLKKGSKEAKLYMAKIRMKKASTKTKKTSSKVGAYKRKTETEYEVYGYYPTGKEVVYTASSSNEAKQIIKDYKANEPRIKFTYMPKRVKKIGSTLLLEKGESPRKKPTRIVQVNRTKKGVFKKFRSISGVSNTDDAKRLKQLAMQSKSPLFKKVATILIAKYKNGGYPSLQSVLEDVQHGLQSGIISELIYYRDTLAWFKKYKTEIAKMLRDTMSEMGVDSPSDVFGNNWDKDDYFAQDTHNQNLLAWFSFEETARNIGYSLGYDI